MALGNFVTKSEMKEILANAPQGTRPEIILRGLANKGKVIEGFNEDQQSRNRPAEFVGGIGRSLVSYGIKTAGSILKGGEAIGKSVGKLQDRLPGVKRYMGESMTPKSLEGLGEKVIGAGDRADSNVKNFMGETGVRTDTTAAQGGKVVGDVVQSTLLGPRGPKFPGFTAAQPGLSAFKDAGLKEGTKMFARYAGPKSLIGATEELRYNIGTEGSLTREGGTPDFVVGVLAEVLAPVGINMLLRKFAFKPGTEALEDVVSRAVKKTLADPSDVAKATPGIDIATKAVSSSDVGKITIDAKHAPVVQKVLEDLNAGKITEGEAVSRIMIETGQTSTSKEIMAGLPSNFKNQLAGKDELVNEYWAIGKAREAGLSAPTPMEYTVQKAIGTRDAIVKLTNDTGSGVGAYKKASSLVPNKIADVTEITDWFTKEMKAKHLIRDGEKFIAEPGFEANVKLRNEAGDLNVYRDFYNGITALNGQTRLDAFEILAGVRDKASFSSGIKGTASSKVEKVSKGLSHKMRETLQRGMSKEDKALFDEYSYLISFLQDVNKYADSRSGFGVLLRRVLSAKGGDAQKMFSVIKKYTGVDLMDDAVASSVVTNAIGDKTSKTLLQGMIEDQGISGFEMVADFADNPAKGTFNLIKKLRPKAKKLDIEKTIKNAIKGKEGGLSYQDALDLVESIKKAGYKGSGVFPTTS